MTDRIPPPPGPPGATTAVSSFSFTTTTSPSFAEAQRRLAARRQERAAEDTARRAQLAASAAAQREASAAALRARLEAGGRLSASIASSSPLVRRIEGSALVAWDGVTRAAASLHGALHGTTESLNGSNRPAFRVSQVDAELLDEELLELLRGQVADALQYIRGGTLQDDWQPEVMLLLRAALFKLSVWDNDATYGAALQNLRYADARVGGGAAGRRKAAVPVAPSKWQKAAYGLVTVGGRYAWTKWEDWLRDHDEDEDPYGEDVAVEESGNNNSSSSRLSFLPSLALSSRAIKRLARVTAVASDVYAGAAFVSFLVFLRYGRYRTLLDRVLRMRLVPPTSQVSREVSFEYLNRQLVWHAFTEFLLFLLPLVGIHRWRRWLTRTWRKTKTAVSKATSAVKGASPLLSGGGGGGGGGNAEDDNENGGETREKKGELAFLPERTCAICYQDQNAATSEADIMAAAAASSGVIGSAETDITNPYEAVPCGCVYCYVSLATRIEREEGDGWTCLRCGTLVTACRPWNGDVLEPASLLPAANGTVIGGGSGGIGASGPDGRPSSSSTNASRSPSYTQKTVGFADDVKGVEDDEAESSNGEIQIDDEEDAKGEEGEEADEEEVDVEESSVDGGDDGEESAEASASDDESEAYEEDEDVEGEGDIDGEVE
ncbi:peroxisome assembly protein (Peroxin-2) [Sporothrix curviconia]|uniref:Peroxisome assembly protein (Peroxin-2) n=1 Tax=Sporothrix curviconia TaxID=1260050 RepID=A0ABP0BEL5_9PEZI